jgi:hypothetical protein
MKNALVVVLAAAWILLSGSASPALADGTYYQLTITEGAVGSL